VIRLAAVLTWEVAISIIPRRGGTYATGLRAMPVVDVAWLMSLATVPTGKYCFSLARSTGQRLDRGVSLGTVSWQVEWLR
jgi:hypothetical protein